MAYERFWAAVQPQAFTVNGGQFGLVTVADTAGFRVKQSASLKNNSNQTLPVQVKVVLNSTTLIVGYCDNKIANWPQLNITAWTVAGGATIQAEWQPKNTIGADDIIRAVYEADPVAAVRVIGVDQYGNPYTDANPLPVAFTGSISIGSVEVKGTNGNFIEPNPDGSLNVIIESQPSPNSTVVSTYNEITLVPSGATTTIVTYTVPAAMQAVLQRCPVSGENVAKYTLLINGATQDTLRTMFGGDLTQMFDFTSGNDSGLVLNAGDVVTIQVLHNRPYTASFEARIQVLQFS